MGIGRIFIVLGIILLLAGIGVVVWPKIFNWFGNLPGDIRIERENSRIFIPITSMIIISVILTLVINGVLWLISNFFRFK
jgi:uncharacterized protein HemY